MDMSAWRPAARPACHRQWTLRLCTGLRTGPQPDRTIEAARWSRALPPSQAIAPIEPAPSLNRNGVLSGLAPASIAW